MIFEDDCNTFSSYRRACIVSQHGNDFFHGFGPGQALAGIEHVVEAVIAGRVLGIITQTNLPTATAS